MSIVLRLSACLLVTASLAACNKSEPATPSPSAATQAAAPATPAAQAPAADAAPAPASTDDDTPVALDMGKVEAWMEAQKNLAHAAETDPKMGDPAQNASEENTTQYAARLDASPTMRDAIRAAGLSTREFARIGDTLIGAMMANAALRSGQLKTLPEGIDQASVDFVKQHEAEIQALMSKGAASGT